MITKRITPFQIASAYIGVTIGAGFASGQEILQYFAFFGPASFVAIALAALLFYYFALLILRWGYEVGAESYREVVHRTGGRLVGFTVDAVITFFLFGSFTAMLAGTGSSLNQQLGLAPVYGALLMAALSMSTVLFGLGGIVSALSFLVPIMFIGILTMTVFVVILFPGGMADVQYLAQPWAAVLPYWPLSAVTYVSYNLIVAVALLAPMGNMAQSRDDIEKGALLGSMGLGLGMLAIDLILLTVPQSFGYTIPMNYVANLLSPLAGSAYTLILLAAIYSTAVGGLYGFCSRLSVPNTFNFRMLVFSVSAAGTAASLIGFTKLVRYLYAGVGVAGFLLLAGLAYTHLRHLFDRGHTRQPNPDNI